MTLEEVREFFDNLSVHWDDCQVDNSPVINDILDLVGISEGVDVLDVACGTGVLFPFYLDRNVGSLTAIDLSPEMVKRAMEKYPAVKVLCGDAASFNYHKSFDQIMIYNAFPHFSNPEAFLASLEKVLTPGGRITVAHGMSRDMINRHHSGGASHVSQTLASAEELSVLFPTTMEVDIVVSDHSKYIVSGYLK